MKKAIFNWLEIINRWINKAPWMIKIFVFLLLFFAVIAIVSCSKFVSSYPQDNIVEEAIEEVIREKTGLDIDLSFETPEDINP